MEFWESLGNPKFAVAPMVELSELSFRTLCRKYNAQLTYTPMLHCGQFARCSKYRDMHFQVSEEDHPIFAQFCGNNPESLIAAASFVEGEVEAIDINLGCPQGIARRGGYGAFLLQEPDLIVRILSTMKLALNTPITCKIRKVSSDLQQTLNLCYALEANGCSAICVHGRTKEAKSQLTGSCDWEAIRIIKERLAIPVIANGGIETFEDAERCLAFTRADTVMSAEGILDYPALFSGNPRIDRLYLAEQYMEQCKLFPPKSKGCIKAHLFRLLYGRLEAAPALRTQLATATKWEEFVSILESLRHHPTPSVCSKWYYRHRKELTA